MFAADLPFYILWNMSKSRSGFTVVELLIVVVVIAILAMISITAYTSIQRRANESAAMASAKAAATTIASHQVKKGAYPETLAEAGIPSQDLQYVVSNTSSPATFCVTATSGSSSYFVSESQPTPLSGGCPGHGVGGIAAITNIAPNPSAESNLGWPSNNGSVYPRTFDTTVVRSGSQSIESHNVSSSTALMSLYGVGALNGNGFDVAPSKTYHISYYFRSGVPHQGRISCSFRLSDNTYTTTAYGSYHPGSVDQWSRASHTCTSPANATILRLGINVYALSTQPANTPAYADDLMVVEGTTQYQYADGSSPSWIWNGTPDASTSTGPAQ